MGKEVLHSSFDVEDKKDRQKEYEEMQFTFIDVATGSEERKDIGQRKVAASENVGVGKEGLFCDAQHETAVSQLTALKKRYLETYLKTGSPTATAREMGGVSSKHVAKEMRRIAGRLGFSDTRQMRSASRYANVVKEQSQDASASDLLAMVERQGYRCALSGSLLTPAIARLDHIEPLSSGGDNKISNLQWVTEEVNTAKGTMSQDAFVRMCVAVAKHVGIAGGR